MVVNLWSMVDRQKRQNIMQSFSQLKIIQESLRQAQADIFHLQITFYSIVLHRLFDCKTAGLSNKPFGPLKGIILFQSVIIN